MRYDTAKLATNYRHVFSLATQGEIDAGLSWYPTAHAGVVELARIYGRSVANIACITAMLSPQCSWERNVLATVALLSEDTPVGPYQTNIRKAERILADNAITLDGYVKDAPKVRAFAANLGGSYDVVTVDTHMAQCGILSPVDTPRIDTFAKYAPFHEAVIIASQDSGILPAHYQAVCWIVWKRLYPTGRKLAILNNRRHAHKRR